MFVKLGDDLKSHEGPDVIRNGKFPQALRIQKPTSRPGIKPAILFAEKKLYNRAAVDTISKA